MDAIKPPSGANKTCPKAIAPRDHGLICLIRVTVVVAAAASAIGALEMPSFITTRPWGCVEGPIRLTEDAEVYT